MRTHNLCMGSAGLVVEYAAENVGMNKNGQPHDALISSGWETVNRSPLGKV
jgi:hypothetical protein